MFMKRGIERLNSKEIVSYIFGRRWRIVSRLLFWTTRLRILWRSTLIRLRAWGISYSCWCRAELGIRSRQAVPQYEEVSILISNVSTKRQPTSSEKSWLYQWYTMLVWMYLGKSKKYLSSKLILDNLCFLVDEPKDIRREHRNEIIVIPESLFIILTIIVFFILLESTTNIVLHYLFVVLYKVGHEFLHLWFKISHIRTINSCSRKHSLVIIYPCEKGD